MPHKLIATRELWWSFVDAHWANILHTVIRVGGSLDQCQDGYGSLIPLPLGVYMEHLRSYRDPELAALIFQTWSAAPDRAYFNKWPSWDIICALCENADVLTEEPIYDEPSSKH